MEENENGLVNDKTEISKDFSKQSTILEQQIDVLNQKILQLQGHILTIETANSTMEQMARIEKDATKKSKIFAAMRYNLELLVKMYSTIKEYEDVKFRYHKEIDDMLHNKYKLIAIDIRRIEKGLDGPNSGIAHLYERLTDLMSDQGKLRKIEQDLADNPEYRL